MNVLAALALAALIGCAPKQAPKVFARALVPMVEPELVKIPAPTADAVPAAAAMKPGQVVPYVDPETCQATHRAVLVPEDQVAELVQDQERATFWARRASVERQGREQDRTHCERVAASLDEENQVLRKDARILRWAAPVALVVGIFLGALAGAAGERIGGSP